MQESGRRGSGGVRICRGALAEWIRHHRRAAAISQEQLAMRLTRMGSAVSRSTLSRWEQGRAAPPGDVVPLLAQALGAPLANLEELVARAGARTEIDLTGRSFDDLRDEGERAARAGRLVRAAAFFEAAHHLILLEAAQPTPEEHAMVLLRLAWARLHGWQLYLARQALGALARLPGLPWHFELRAFCLHLTISARSGDPLAARAFAESIGTAIARPDCQPDIRALGHHALGRWHFLAERYPEAAEALSLAVEGWKKSGNSLEATRADALLGYSIARTGRAADGERRLRSSREAAALLGSLEVEALAERLLGRLLGETGRRAEAADRLETAAGLARRSGVPEEEFLCRWHAWRFADPAEKARIARALRRLLPDVHPAVPEVLAFLEATGAGENGREDTR